MTYAALAASLRDLRQPSVSTTARAAGTSLLNDFARDQL
jgi:hypothetical protein